MIAGFTARGGGVRTIRPLISISTTSAGYEARGLVGGTITADQPGLAIRQDDKVLYLGGGVQRSGPAGRRQTTHLHVVAPNRSTPATRSGQHSGAGGALTPATVG